MTISQERRAQLQTEVKGLLSEIGLLEEKAFDLRLRARQLEPGEAFVLEQEARQISHGVWGSQYRTVFDKIYELNQ